MTAINNGCCLICRKSDTEVTIDVSRKLAQKSCSPESMVTNNKLTPKSLKHKLVDTVGQLKRKCDFSNEEFEHASKKSPTMSQKYENGNMFEEGLFCKPCGKRMIPVDIPKWAEESVSKEKLCNVYTASSTDKNQCDHVKFIANQLDINAEHCISPKLTEKNVLKTAGSDVLAKYSKWNPEISCITTASSRVQNLVESVASEDSCLSFNPLNTRLDSFSSGTSSSLCGNMLYNTLQQESSCESMKKQYPLLSPTDQYINASKDNALLEYPSRSSSPASSVTESRVADMTDFDHMTTLGNDVTVECSVNSENELRRDLSVRTLIKCEEEYLRCMQRGIQTYSRPLRFCVLSTEQNEVLFQNIEKVGTL